MAVRSSALSWWRSWPKPSSPQRPPAALPHNRYVLDDPTVGSHPALSILDCISLGNHPLKLALRSAAQKGEGGRRILRVSIGDARFSGVCPNRRGTRLLLGSSKVLTLYSCGDLNKLAGHTLEAVIFSKHKWL